MTTPPPPSIRPDANQPRPQFNPGAPHHTRPKVRSLRGMPVQAQDPQGKPVQLLGLTDARQISDKMVVTAPAAQMVIPLLDGSRGIDEIVTQVGRGLNAEILQALVAQLDDAALLEGPTFDALLAKTRQEFDASEILPPASTAQFTDMLVVQKVGEKATEQDKQEQGPKLLRELMDKWMAEALKNVPRPMFDALPKAVVGPHLDYGRGWLNYSHIYGRLRGAERPDRVIILGTNHFGLGTGVVGCDKGYETAFGVSRADTDLVAQLRAALGDAIFSHRYDHEREHSIELHVPWIQHVFGKNHAGEYPRIFGALVHDPAVNNGQSYDGKGVALESFVSALKSALATLPGRTLVVSSADLSHAGPAFGDQQPLAGEEEPAKTARENVFKHDMQLLDMLVKNKPSEVVASMAWQQNPTRWCSTGNIVAAMMLTEPTQIELLNYAASMDPQGMTMVSSAAMAMK